MSRVNPLDVGLPAGCIIYKAGSAAGFENLVVRLPRQPHLCPNCGRTMVGHGTFPKQMAHAVGHAPCRLEVKVPRSRCKKCGVTVSEEVPFESAVSPGVTEALEKRIVELIRSRITLKDVAAFSGVPYDTVKLVIDGIETLKPVLPAILLMDEIHAFSYRDPDTGKLVAVYWTCIYDGADGKLVDMVDGHDEKAVDRWFSQFDASERNSVRAFCSDMCDTFLNAAAKWLRLAVRAVDRFHVAKDGVAHIDAARRRIQKGAGNGAAIKRRARKLAVNRGKRRRECADKPWFEQEKRVTCDVLRVCDSKHSALRQAFLVLQLYYIWQDNTWESREACDKALCDWIMKATGLAVPEIAEFGRTVARYRQPLVTGTIARINSARAESTNDKIKELKKRGRGFGGFAETRKRLLIAFGRPDAVELPTARARRMAEIAEQKAAAKAKKAAKAKRKHRR